MTATASSVGQSINGTDAATERVTAALGNFGHRTYQRVWSGLRTSEGAEDCGRDADLILTQTDINALASAAGDFGVNHSPGSSLR